jgi:hypothetical protein
MKEVKRGNPGRREWGKEGGNTGLMRWKTLKSLADREKDEKKTWPTETRKL